MAKARSMNVHIEGVTLEPMLQGGVEILAGVTRDPVFGWMLTVGLGGVWTELMKDACHSLLPVDAAGAEACCAASRASGCSMAIAARPRPTWPPPHRQLLRWAKQCLPAGAFARSRDQPAAGSAGRQGAVAVDALVLLDPAKQWSTEHDRPVEPAEG